MPKKKYTKKLVLAAKIILAAGMLMWVLSRVHWRDYVIDASDHKTYAVVDARPSMQAPAEISISIGSIWERDYRWVAADKFEKIPGSDAIIRQGFASSIIGIRVPLLLAASGCFLFVYLILALRWWLLLRIQAIYISPWEAVRLTFLGQFFNTVVPGTVGGDVVKAYYVAGHTHRKAAALLSILVDRIIGACELSLLAAVMIAFVWLWGFSDASRLKIPAMTIAVVLVIVAAAMTFLLSSRVRGVLHLEKFYSKLSIAHHIADAGEAARLYRRKIKLLIWTILITLVSHLVWIWSIAMLGASLSLDIAWHNYFVYVPLIYIIGAVPLTPGGVGLIEQLFVSFFVVSAVSGPSPSQILALALLARMLPVFWGLPGAIVAVTGARPAIKEARSEGETAL